MNTRQQYELDGLVRSQEFLDWHDAELGPLKDTEGRRLLDAAVAQVGAHRLGQWDAQNGRRAATARKEALAAELKEQHMKPIAKFARAKLPYAPNFAAMSETGRRLRGSELVSAARAMATALEPVAAVLVAAQFPVDVVAQLKGAADVFEKSLGDHAAKKVAMGVATASVRQHLMEGRRAVALLDPVVTRKLAGNAGLLEGWRQAKRVVKKPGVVAGAVAAQAAPEAVPVVPAASLSLVQQKAA